MRITPPPARILTWRPNLEASASGAAPQGGGLMELAGEPRLLQSFHGLLSTPGLRRALHRSQLFTTSPGSSGNEPWV